MQPRSLLEKCLILLVAALVVIVFVLGTWLIVSNNRDLPKGEEYCLSEKCIKTAAEILSSLDKTVDPCDDFYQYACGNWIRANPIPDGESVFSRISMLEQQNQLVVKNALQKPISEMKSEAERKAKFYYTSCMDPNGTIETLGAEPMLKLIDDVGGWSVSGRNFNISTWNLQSLLNTLQNKYINRGLFVWGMQEDEHNSSLYSIKIDQGGLTLIVRDTYLNVTENEKLLAAYLDYMVEVGVLLGGEYNATKVQMEAVLDFETKLASIFVPADERTEENMYNQMNITQLQEIAPFMSWIEYFSYAFGLVQKNITVSERVVVYAPQYLTNLTTVIQSYMSTDEGKNTLNNYLLWQTVRRFTSSLSKPFRDAYKGFNKAFTGAEGELGQWSYCTDDTNNVIGFAIGAMYVRDVFQGDSKTKAEDMINRTRTAFKENLRGLSWMDQETMALAEDKADAITDMIGFPDFIVDQEKLDERYKDLEVSESSYFDNIMNANQFIFRRALQQLGTPVDKIRWDMMPQSVNAYYSATRNQIVFPAGILQAPFYDATRQQSLNFGSIGMVMGHEITHAFDDEGRKYDKYGNVKQWWNNNTIEKFTNQTQCLIKQYSDYEINGKHVNGKQTLGENIADNGGLKAAFRAYTDWAKTHEKELPLPALNLTHRQLFFLSFAQVWCSATTDEYANLLIERDPHSPAKFRTIGTLSNSPEFAQEFKCPSGSKMNPTKKCEVW